MKVLVKEIHFSIDLERIYRYLYKNQPYSFWLDGKFPNNKLSKFSFIGGKPKFVIDTHRGKTRMMVNNKVTIFNDNPFAVIEHLLASYSVEENEELQHIPFIGGLVGYFGYEMMEYINDFKINKCLSSFLPQAKWMFCDRVLIYDHLSGRSFLTQLVDFKEEVEAVRQNLDQWCEEIYNAQQRCSQIEIDFFDVGEDYNNLMLETPETFAQYCQKIVQIKEHIFRGDVYQACYTYPFITKLKVDSFQLYQVMRKINPAPFSSYLRMGSFQIASASPERFLRLSLDKVLESRPIKGTRPRSLIPIVDNKLREDLQNSVKDRAENVMIVDLVRNDLGKISETGSVSVPELLKIESYATVHQLVSSVMAHMRADINPITAIKAVFPGGSMTGAPKLSALNILQRLERQPRGIYAGGLGYLDVRGSFDLSMVIRSIICHSKGTNFNVGGGIVSDSDPTQEFQETLDKACALIKAISICKDNG